ncbi:MAG: hypothetical protein Kow0077_05340 [Anaerolineae bacterium]
MEQKTVFISYRRDKSKHLARAIYLDLTHHGWDVFLDVTTIDSGDFDRIILNQIKARAHFVLLISRGSLERCQNQGDWLRREIEEAVRLERNIVPVIEEGADFEHEMGYLPEGLRAVIRKKNGLPLPHFFFDAAMEMLRTRFLKTPEYIRVTAAPPEDHAEIQRRLAVLEPPKPRSIDLMPPPFDWIEIPGGRGTLQTDISDLTLSIPTERYWIAKYPITNAQFAKFMEAGGYDNERWWTAEGWKIRKEGWHWDNGWKPSGIAWTQPRYWNNSKWNGPDQPVVGVSWFEAVAFCLWLSDVTGEKIMLPTEAQWQYAAQGKDGRAYPWGNDWDCKRCNNSVSPCDSSATTPVTQYERTNKSYFNVVDMAGNVWEWCLTDYDNQTNDVNSRAEKRVLRGGSWYFLNPDSFRCDARFRLTPDYGASNGGFRPARS